MYSLSNASGDVVFVEDIVHECEEILLDLIRELSVSNLRDVNDKAIAVVRSPLLEGNGTPWRTTTLRVLDVVEHNLSTRLVIRVENVSRRLTLSPVSLPSLSKSFLLELLRLFYSPHDVVSSDDEPASHVCPFYSGNPRALLQTRGL